MNNSSLLGPWIRRFLIEYLVGERNLAINTQKSYRDMLMLLLPYLAAKVDKRIDRLSVDDLSAQMVRLFLTHMEEQRHCMVSTRNQRLGGIHALARFIGEHAPEYVDWWAQIHLIPVKRTSRPEISYLSRQEMDALLAASDMHTVQGQREHALLLFMFNSGARASEAAQLRIGDIDWHTRSASIVGKGNKHRRCPLWKSTIEALRSQTEGRAAAEPVFLNRFHQTMTRSGIHALVKRCAIRAAASAPSLAGKNVQPHVNRHTTASLLLQAGVDINTIRGWLYEGLVPRLGVIDIDRLRANLQVSRRSLRTALIQDEVRPRWSTSFRFCRQCLGYGYHSILHQFESLNVCPAHHCAVESACRRCGHEIPYRINVQLLEAQYRCANCLSSYPKVYWTPSRARPMKPGHCKAFTRRYMDRRRG